MLACTPSHSDLRSPGFRHRAAFSLIEVIAAIAIFAVGLVAVLGLLAPVTKSVANVADAEAAAYVADAVRARLQSLPFDQAAGYLQDAAAVQKNDASGSYNPNAGAKNPLVIFGKLTGEIGFYSATATPRGWVDYNYSTSPPALRAFADADKYFEIELIRDAARTTDILLAYTLRVRWPAFLPSGSANPIQVGANPSGGAVTFDHGRKQTLFFTGTVTR